jgi:hypothetical protein
MDNRKNNNSDIKIQVGGLDSPVKPTADTGANLQDTIGPTGDDPKVPVTLGTRTELTTSGSRWLIGIIFIAFLGWTASNFIFQNLLEDTASPEMTAEPSK